jgi:PKD repeat protein
MKRTFISIFGIVVLLTMFLTAIPAAAVDPGVTFRSYGSSPGVNGTSCVILKPAGLTVGDLMIAQVVGSDPNYTSGGDLGTFTAPSGWASIRQDNKPIGAGSGGIGLASALFWKIAVQADVDATSFTFTATNATSNRGAITAWYGQDPTTPINANNGQGNGPPSTTVTSPGITPVANCMILLFCGIYDNNAQSNYAIATNNPSPWAEAYDLNSDLTYDLGLSVGYATRPQTTATGNGTATTSGSAENTGQLVAIRPAAGPTNPTVTINQAGAQVDPTNSSPINFTVVFSESVTGFGNVPTDVTLSGTAGATSATVSGPGPTYNVAVSGMTTGGTVIATIPAGAATGSSSLLPNLASTSSDNQVTYTYTVPNPALSDTCGLDIVLVMDESTSIDGTAFTQMQAAFVAFVNALLPATPTQFALVVFGTNAQVQQTWTSDAATIIGAINAPRLLTGTQYTNWEQGLLTAQGLFATDRPANPDLIIFASDGDPTAYGNNPVYTNVTADVAMPYAITVANAIKTAGIRIATIGIGASVNSDNLKAISSADAYYSASDFSTLAAALAQIASELCGGTITVHKIIDVDGDLLTTGDQIDGTPTSDLVANWRYDLNVSGGSANPTYAYTNNTGITVAFDITGSPATVTVTETENAGYALFAVQWSGGSGGSYSPSTDSFTITVGSTDIVSVTFYNTPTCGPCEVFNPTNGQCVDDPSKDPTAGFSATPLSGCPPLTVQFTDASTSPVGAILTCSWDFDNNGTPDSTAQNPSYQYTNAGTYTVSLTVTNTCGSDTETKTGYITVNPLPVATAANNGPVCEGATLTLTGGPDGMASYSWTGPNGFTSSSQSPTVSASATLAMDGIYTLTVTNSNGCQDTESTDVTVNALPVATASNNGPVCEGATLTLTGGPDGMASYSWTGPDGFSSSSQSPTVSASATLAMDGIYTLTVTNSNNCTDTETTDVTVNALPIVEAGPALSFCADAASISLTGTGESPSGGTWSGDGVSGTTFDPAAAGVGAHTITYTYTDLETHCYN